MRNLTSWNTCESFVPNFSISSSYFFILIFHLLNFWDKITRWKKRHRDGIGRSCYNKKKVQFEFFDSTKLISHTSFDTKTYSIQNDTKTYSIQNDTKIYSIQNASFCFLLVECSSIWRKVLLKLFVFVSMCQELFSFLTPDLLSLSFSPSLSLLLFSSCFDEFILQKSSQF